MFVSVENSVGIDTATVSQILYRNGGHNSAQPRMSDEISESALN